MNIKNGIIIVAISFSLLSFTSCGGEKGSNGGDHNTSETSDIKLNNGQKWLVNAEMKPHIEAMDKIIMSFDGVSLLDYTSMGASLKEHTQTLISSCTMTGPSHDELHVWLLPYLKSVNKLAETTDKEEAVALFGNIKSSIETYKKYFK